MDERCSEATFPFWGNFLVRSNWPLPLALPPKANRLIIVLVICCLFVCLFVQDQLAMVDPEQSRFLLEFYSAHLTTLMQVGVVSWWEGVAAARARGWSLYEWVGILLIAFFVCLF